MWALKNKKTGEFLPTGSFGIPHLFASKSDALYFIKFYADRYIIKDWTPVKVKVVLDD